MHIYDKKDTESDYAGKVQKMAKLAKFMPGFEISWLFWILVCVDFFYHAATNCKLDGNWKISSNIIHFLSFAGMLPIIFGIFGPSSHFCKARQKRKFPVKMMGMTGPS